MNSKCSLSVSLLLCRRLRFTILKKNIYDRILVRNEKQSGTKGRNVCAVYCMGVQRDRKVLYETSSKGRK